MRARIACGAAVLGGLWALGVVGATEGLRDLTYVGWQEQVAVLWTLSALVWFQAGTRVATVAGDVPARVVGASAAFLGPARSEWAAGMVAEVAGIEDRRERARFALGCARAALFPPRPVHVPLVVAAVTAAAIAVVAPWARGADVFWTALALLLGTTAFVLWDRVRLTGIGVLTATGALVGAVMLLLGGRQVAPDAALVAAAALAACVALGLAAPRSLTSSKAGRRAGVAGAALLTAGLVAGTALDEVRGPLATGLFLFVLALAVVPAVCAAAVVADGSLRAGVQAAVWSAALGAVGVFLVGVSGIGLVLGPYGVDPLFALVLQGPFLHAFAYSLAVLPSWWVPLGVLAAAATRRLSSPPGKPVR